MSVLHDRTALVTGASRGIGRAVADRLQQDGARVACLARSFEGVHDATRLEIPCDVTEPDDVHRAVEHVVERFGVPDIVVNNAGAFLLKPLVETTAEEFLAQLSVNTLGPFLVVRAMLPHLVRVRHGHLVTIGSVVDHRPYAGNAAYGASKYGVRGLHEILVEELRATGIRATLISPGPTDTRLWDPMEARGADEMPARSDMLTPDDVAAAVAYAVTQPERVAVEWIRLMPVS